MQVYFVLNLIQRFTMKKTICNILFSFYFLTGTFPQTDSNIVALPRCIEAALSYNPIIKEAGNNVSVSSTGIRLAQSGRYPLVSFGASGGLSDEYRQEDNLKTGAVEAAASQLLWQYGKITSSVEQATFISEASRAAFETRKQEVIIAVKTTYFTCLLQQQLYHISQDNVAKANLFLEYARERYKAGAGRKSDVLKAESDLAEARFECSSYKNALKQAQNELAMLTGFEVYQLLFLDDSPLSTPVNTFQYQTDSLIGIILSQYPELQEVKELRSAQMAKIEQVKADLYPRLAVSAGYNWNYNPVLRKRDGWYSVLSLRWDIFNGNEKHYRIQTERIKKDIYDNRAEDLKNFLIKEVNNGIISIKEAEDQIMLTNSIMKTTSENLEMAEAQYLAGTGSLLELADARITNLSTKQKNIQATVAYLIALASIERLTGYDLNLSVKSNGCSIKLVN